MSTLSQSHGENMRLSSGCLEVLTRSWDRPLAVFTAPGGLAMGTVSPSAEGERFQHTNRLSIVATRSLMERNGFAVPAGTASGSAPCAC
jgi:hypothetical protein